MSYSFEYIDIILLAMIAGFIFLRLRGILGKKSGFEEDITQSFPHEFPNVNNAKKTNFDVFDDKAKSEFLSGAKIAYETIISDFSKGNLKNIKSLLEKKVLKQFEDAISEREKQGNVSETTFIGINSAEIKNHERNGNFGQSGRCHWENMGTVGPCWAWASPLGRRRCRSHAGTCCSR